MPMRKYIKKIVAIALTVAVIAGLCLYVVKSKPYINEPPSQSATPNPTDRYLRTLEMGQWSLLQTTTYMSLDKTDNGTAYALTEVMTSQLSVSPNLYVYQALGASVSAQPSDDPEVTQLVADIAELDQSTHPLSYIAYDDKSQTMTYYDEYNGEWTYMTSPLYVSDAPYSYARLWELQTQPSLIDDYTLEARDANHTGTYQFTFNPETAALVSVHFVSDDGTTQIGYQVLDVPPVLSVPAEIVDNAVPFDPEDLMIDEIAPVISDQVYVPTLD